MKYCFEEMTPGRTFAIGPKTVTPDEIIAFASEFDPAPFHLDEEAGRRTILGGLSASGWHVCSMAMRMMCDAFLLESSCLGSPGIRECKWMAPVLAGDTLGGTVTVETARPSASRAGIGVVEVRVELANQHGRPVTVFWNAVLMGMREAA